MDVDELITALKHGSDAQKRDAALMLGKEDSPKGLEALIEAFGDDSWLVREVAVESILTRKSDDAVTLFLSALKDKDARVRNSAIEILTGLGSTATDALIKALRTDDDAIIRYCADCLGNIGDTRAGKPLLDALERSDGDSRYNIIIALGKLKDAGLAAHLTRYLDEDLWIQTATIEALGNMGEKKVVNDILRVMGKDEFLIVPAIEAIGRIGAPEAIPALIKNLGAKSEEVIAATVKALAGIKERNQGWPEECLPPQTVKDINVKGVVSSLRSQDPEVRASSAIVLGWLMIVSAIGPLAALLTDEDEDVRLKAGESLVKFGEASVEPLIRTMKRPEKMAKLSAIQVLEKIGGQRVVMATLRLLTDATDNDLKLACIRLLGTTGDKRAFDGLIKLLDDEDEAIRSTVVHSLTQLQLGNKERKRLVEMLGQAGSAKKRALIEISGKLKIKEALNSIKSMLADEETAVRQQAVLAIAEIDGKRSVGSLPVMLLGSEDPLVRQSAASLLGRLNDQRGVEPLIYTAVDPDPWVRYQSIHSLGLLKDRRAVDVVKKSVDDKVGAVRIAAARSLAQIAPEEITEGLINIERESDEDVRQSFLETILEANCQRPKGFFVKALQDSSWKVREIALKGVSLSDDKESLSKIKEMCSDRNALVREMAWKLLKERS